MVTEPVYPVRCLVVDDEPAILLGVNHACSRLEGLELTLCDGGQAALEQLRDEDSFDLVLTDLRMPEVTGMEVLAHVRRLSPDIPVLVMSAVATVDEVLALQEAGATLFQRKPFGVPELLITMKHAMHLARQLRSARHLQRVRPGTDVTVPGLIGRSPPFVRSLVNLSALARTDAPLLIGGETGSGKELVARAAHALSRRRDGPFVAVNCSALTESIVDGELFGHIKGSFTGALRDSPGLIRSAHGGTLFLDEIGDLHASAQAKLLRVVQEKEVRPVGSTQSVRVDVRIVAATHRDLGQMVERGEFRRDLFYRLRVGEVRLPPLRERPDDILLLAEVFLKRCRDEFGAVANAFLPAAVQAMMQHTWPGNVRELEGCVTRAAAVCTGTAIAAEDLGLGPAAGSAPGVPAQRTVEPNGPLPAFSEAKATVIERFERAYVTRLVREYPTFALAARHAGIDRKSLYRLLRKHGLGQDAEDEPHDDEPGSPVSG